MHKSRNRRVPGADERGWGKRKCPRPGPEGPDLHPGHHSPRPAATSPGSSRADPCWNCEAPAGSPSSDPRTAWPVRLHLLKGAVNYKAIPQIHRPKRTNASVSGARAHRSSAPTAASSDPEDTPILRCAGAKWGCRGYFLGQRGNSRACKLGWG